MKTKLVSVVSVVLVAVVLMAVSQDAFAKKRRHRGENSGPPVNCNKLGETWKRRMNTVPYKSFSDKQVKKCVATYTVSNKTMPIFTGAAFYFKSYDVRLDASSRLEEYSCEDQKSCEAFYNLIDKHLQAYKPDKDSEKFFQNRMNKIRDKALASFNEFKTPKATE